MAGARRPSGRSPARQFIPTAAHKAPARRPPRPVPPRRPRPPRPSAPPSRHAATAPPPGPLSTSPPAPPTPLALSVPPAAFGRPAPAPPRRSRRALLAALAAVLLLAAAAIGAYILRDRLSSRPLATIPIAAASTIAPVTGDEYVIYRAGQNASARVHGEVSHVIRGETAGLYAQPFPYRHAPVPVGSVVLKASRERGRVRVLRDPEPGHALLRGVVPGQQRDRAAGPLADRDHLRHQGRGRQARPEVR